MDRLWLAIMLALSEPLAEPMQSLGQVPVPAPQKLLFTISQAWNLDVQQSGNC